MISVPVVPPQHLSSGKYSAEAHGVPPLSEPPTELQELYVWMADIFPRQDVRF